MKPRRAGLAPGEIVVAGDRVKGLRNFGKSIGDVETREWANEDDAVVKWDDDDRMTFHQPWLKKI